MQARCLTPQVCFVISVCLCVCDSLGRPGNESMAWQLHWQVYSCFKLAGLFASSVERKPSDASTIDGRDTVLLAQAQCHERVP